MRNNISSRDVEIVFISTDQSSAQEKAIKFMKESGVAVKKIEVADNWSIWIDKTKLDGLNQTIKARNRRKLVKDKPSIVKTPVKAPLQAQNEDEEELDD